MQVVRLPVLSQGHVEGPHPREAQPTVLDVRPQLVGRGRPAGTDLAEPGRAVGRAQQPCGRVDEEQRSKTGGGNKQLTRIGRDYVMSHHHKRFRTVAPS
jgi:hypothetical protein